MIHIQFYLLLYIDSVFFSTHISYLKILQVSDGVIPALVDLVRAEDIETVRYACAALCRLCSTMENGNLILESGAVPNLVERAIKG